MAFTQTKAKKCFPFTLCMYGVIWPKGPYFLQEPLDFNMNFSRPALEFSSYRVVIMYCAAKIPHRKGYKWFAYDNGTLNIDLFIYTMNHYHPHSSFLMLFYSGHP